MDEGGSVREDLCLPKGQLGESMRKLFESGEEVTVTVTSAVDQEAITAVAARQHKRGRGMTSMWLKKQNYNYIFVKKLLICEPVIMVD